MEKFTYTNPHILRPAGTGINMQTDTPIKDGSEIFRGDESSNEQYVNVVDIDGPYSYECEAWTTWDLLGMRTHFKITPVPFCMEDVVGVFYD